ncbi:hypothetical protein BN961_00664 [Afipia felis]|uniref:Uncharacterized protein n=1 Tax=Afipia felis TaxID=1035 RepID=A0A090MLV1_AFIFE|nr:hypothetical protein BN961_00664 [Afipia felis]
MEDVAANQSELSLQVERGEDLAGDDAACEAGRIAVHGCDHQVGDLLAVIVPGFAIRQFRRDVLAEQACDMRVRRGEAVVQRGRDQHFHHRLAAPAMLSRVMVGAVHVGKRRRKDDAAGEMVTHARQRGEGGQRGERDVHPERAGAVAIFFDARGKRCGQCGLRHEARVKQRRIDVGDDIAPPQRFAVLQRDADGAAVLDQNFADTGFGFDLDAMTAGG